MRWLWMFFLLMCLVPSDAEPPNRLVMPDESFASSTQQKAFLQLTQTLRCLVCQNQTIADSSAPFAQDLRREVYERMKQGESPDAIRAYLVAHYGHFIVFDPPWHPSAYLLWVLPSAFLLLAVLVGLRWRRR